MFRHERYFDKNENQSNYYGQLEEVLTLNEEEESTKAIPPADNSNERKE